MRRVLYGLAVLLAIASGSSWAASLTASDILTRARVYLKDNQTTANRQYFSDATLLGFLNDGQKEANALNWVLTSSATVTMVAGTAEYAMPDDFMAAQRVWFKSGSTYRKLDATSLDQLDSNTQGWQSSTGLAQKYYLDKIQSSVLIGVWPVPTATSTGTVIVYYTQNVTDMTALTQKPFNGWMLLQPYVDMLAYYVAYRGYLALEETDVAGQYLQYWVQALQTIRQGTFKQPDFNPPAAGNRGP